MTDNDIQQRQESILEMLGGMDTSYRKPADERAPRYGRYHLAAAVLSVFQTKSLNPLAQIGPADPEEEVDALLADCSVIQRKDQAWWALRTDVRREALRQLGTRSAMKKALAANPGRECDNIQRMLEAYIRNDARPLEKQTSRQLAGTLQVVDWLAAVLDDLPKRTAVLRRLELLDLVQPFYDITGEQFGQSKDDAQGPRFRGRQRDLQDLRDYVGVLPPGSVHGKVRRRIQEIFDLKKRPPLVIYGVGGIGKSSLVGKFIREHATLPKADRFPWTYIDFDHIGFQAEEPLTLLIEAVRQLGIQYPEARTHTDSVRTSWWEALERKAQISDKAATSSGRTREWKRVLRDFRYLLDNLKVAEAPFLLVLDTFEEVQYHGPDVVADFFEFLAVFQREVPRLRTVIAGREKVEVSRYTINNHALGDFDDEAAVGYLQGSGMDSYSARSIARQVGGNPLSLKLALDVWRLEGAKPGDIQDLNSRSLLGFRVQENRIQGLLYKRILDRIHDRHKEVRQLAHPGLVLRRITVDLIREVLAGPCGVTVRDEKHARELFEELGRHVGLVRYDEDGALRHRRDVRLLMLGLMREEDTAKVRQIEEAAVAYYEQQEGVVSRAEEIYHRLSLKQGVDLIAPRWMAGVEDHLYSALEELNARERVWLKAKERLNLPLEADEEAEADQEAWERDVEDRVRLQLKNGEHRKALNSLKRRDADAWLPGSQLFLLKAQAYEYLGERDSVQEAIKAGMESALEKGDHSLAADLNLFGARLDLRADRSDDARQKLAKLEILLAGHGGLRTLEKTLLQVTFARALTLDSDTEFSKVEKVRELFSELPDSSLEMRPDLVAWTAGELGEEDVALLIRATRLNSLATEKRGTLRTLADALARWDETFSREQETSPGLLVKKIDLKRQETVHNTWLAAVLDETPAIMTDNVLQLLELFPEPPLAVRRALVEILREDAPQLAPFLSGAKGMTQSDVEGKNQAAYAGGKLGQRLRGPQIEQFSDALLSAFTWENLEQLVYFRLDRRLSTISIGKNLKHVVFDLIQTAEMEGWTAALLAAALESNPSNRELLELAGRFGLTSVAEQDATLERVIAQSNSLIDVVAWRERLGILETQVCRIERETDKQVSSRSGFLVGPDLLLTTSHGMQGVMDGSIDPGRVRFRFDYRQADDGTLVSEGSVFRLASDWLVDYSPFSRFDLNADFGEPAPEELYYALIRLAGAPGQAPIGGDRAETFARPRGWIPMPAEDPQLVPGSTLMILQGTERGPLRLSLANEVSNANNTRLRYRVKTELGASGAPCFTANWDLVAMHLGSSDSVSFGTPIAAILRLLERRNKLGDVFSE